MTMAKTAARIGAFAFAVGLLAAPGEAQPPASSFDQLQGRVAVGETLWVTDVDGRETRGQLAQLTPTGLTLNGRGTKLFEATAVSLIRHRQRDSLKNGALIGLAAGGGMAVAWCTGALLDDSGDLDPAVECSEGFIFAGLGTLIGVAVDALVPGKMSIVFRADRTRGAAHRSAAMLAPTIASHSVGVSGVFRF
jgi:hypothetical protein